MRTRAVLLGLLAGLLAHLLLAAAVTAVLISVTATKAGAQEPAGNDPALDPALEAQALEIEKQLLCPQCTSKRLDVCELPICDDMRRSIRQQLSEGRAPEDILLYFRSRYGQRVLAEIPREGFNLVLFGWTAGSVALVALLGGGYLLRLRMAASRRRTAAAAGAPEDRVSVEDET